MQLRRAKRAELIKRYHWTPDQISCMTDVQIDLYALHPRDREGEIVRPKPKATVPLTEEGHVRRFLATARVMGITDAAKIAAKVAEIRAHYAAKREQSNADRPEGGSAAPG